MKKLLTATTLFFLCFYLSVHGQNINEMHENCIMHLNSQVFVSGEILKYSVYITDGKGRMHPNPGTMVYFQILGNNNNQVAHWRGIASKGISSGQYELPDSLETGIYIVLAYTNPMRSLPLSEIPAHPVYIVNIADANLRLSLNKEANDQNLQVSGYDNYGDNPSETTGDFSDQRTGTIHQSQPLFHSSTELPLKLTFFSDSIQQGEAIEFLLEFRESSMSEEAIISVSVTEETFFSKQEDIVTIGEESMSLVIEDIYVRENEFFHLTGRVFHRKTGQPLINLPVFLSVTDSVAVLKYSFTSSDGKFGFFLDPWYDNKNVVLQIPEKNLAIDDVMWDVDAKTHPGIHDKSYIFNQIQPSEQITAELEEIRQRGLISRIYYPVHKEELAVDPYPKGNFFLLPDYTVFPEMFEDLENFGEICENILPGVQFHKRRDGYSLGIIDPERREVNTENILLFIDGHPFSNLEVLAAISSEGIQRIEVVNTPFMYGELSYNGLLSIYTKSGIPLSSSIFSVPVHVFRHQTQNLNYRQINPDHEDIDAISHNILWLPQVKTDDRTVRIVSPKIEIKGMYTISIKGITCQGHVFDQSATFKVY